MNTTPSQAPQSFLYARLSSFYFFYFATIGVFIPYLAVTVRRLHDTNRSGWWILMPLATIILVVILAAIVIPMFGTDGANETAGGIAMIFSGN